MNLKNTLTIICLLAFPVLIFAQAAINTTEAPAHESAILDISAPDMGLLIPRVEITDVHSDITPILNPANGLLVYNCGAADADVPKGVYRWSADDTEWFEVINSKSAAMSVYEGGWGGYVMQWGGELELASWAVFGGDAGHGKQSVSDWSTIGVVPRDGEIRTFSWSSEKGDNTSVVAIIINGSTTTLALPAASGIAHFATPIAVTAGDEIEFKNYSGTDPFHTGLMIYIE